MPAPKQKRRGPKTNKEKAIEALTPLGPDPEEAATATSTASEAHDDFKLASLVATVSLNMNDLLIKVLSITEVANAVARNQEQLGTNLNSFATHINGIVGQLMKRLETVESELVAERAHREQMGAQIEAHRSAVERMSNTVDTGLKEASSRERRIAQEQRSASLEPQAQVIPPIATNAKPGPSAVTSATPFGPAGRRF